MGVTAVIFTVVVTWTTTTTATPTTTAGPANKGEARWVRHAAMRALIRIEEEAHEKSSARSQRFENCAQNNTWFAQCSVTRPLVKCNENLLSWHSNHKHKF